MLINILIVVVVAIALFLLFVALRPADFRVERSATIAAAPSVLFEQVNDHRKFTVWNPFMKFDPNVKNTYSGPDFGLGAVCSWDGNSKIGAGSAIALLVLGQGAAAMAIDHFGLMGFARQPVSFSRLAGVALIIGGVILIRR